MLRPRTPHPSAKTTTKTMQDHAVSRTSFASLLSICPPGAHLADTILSVARTLQRFRRGHALRVPLAETYFRTGRFRRAKWRPCQARPHRPTSEGEVCLI